MCTGCRRSPRGGAAKPASCLTGGASDGRRRSRSLRHSVCTRGADDRDDEPVRVQGRRRPRTSILGDVLPNPAAVRPKQIGRVPPEVVAAIERALTRIAADRGVVSNCGTPLVPPGRGRLAPCPRARSARRQGRCAAAARWTRRRVPGDASAPERTELVWQFNSARRHLCLLRAWQRHSLRARMRSGRRRSAPTACLGARPRIEALCGPSRW